MYYVIDFNDGIGYKFYNKECLLNYIDDNKDLFVTNNESTNDSTAKYEFYDGYLIIEGKELKIEFTPNIVEDTDED